MNTARLVSIAFGTTTCLLFFLTYIHLESGAIVRREGLSEVIFALVVSICSLFVIKKIEFNFAKNWPLFLIWSGAIAALIAPHIIRPDYFYGNDHRLLACLIVLWVFIPFSILLQSLPSQFPEAFVHLMINVALLYSAVFFVAYVSGIHGPPYKSNLNYLFPGFYNIRHMGYVFAPLLAMSIVSISYVLSKPRQKIHWLYFIGLTVLFSLLLWSGSRAGMLSVLVAIAFTAFLSKISRRQIIRTFLWSFFIGLALESLYPYAGRHLGFWNALFSEQNYSNANAISSGRLDMWQLAIENIRSHPFLGYGIEGFKEYAALLPKSQATQIHNGYLEYFHAGGIFAGIGIFSVVGFYYAKLCLHLRNTSDWTLLATFTALTAVFISAFLNGVLFHYRPLMHAVLFFAIANHLMKREQKD